MRSIKRKTLSVSAEMHYRNLSKCILEVNKQKTYYWARIKPGIGSPEQVMYIQDTMPVRKNWYKFTR